MTEKQKTIDGEIRPYINRLKNTRKKKKTRRHRTAKPGWKLSGNLKKKRYPIGGTQR